MNLKGSIRSLCPLRLAGVWALAVLAACHPSGSEQSPRTQDTTTSNRAPSSVSSSATLPKGPTNSATKTFSLDATEDPSTTLHKAGFDAVARGDFAGAVEEFKKLIQTNPQDEEAQFNLGYAYSQLGRREEAIHHYEECLKWVPGYAEAHNNLGNLLVGKKEFEAGLMHFKKALESQPENSGAQNNNGKVFALQSKLLEAIPYFQAAVQLNPRNYEARYNLGTAYLSTGQYEEAQKELGSVLEENPGMEPARKALQRVQAILAQRAGQAKPIRP